MIQGRICNDFYARFETAAPMTRRLELIVEAFRDHRERRVETLDVLDDGRGRQALLSRFMREGDRYIGHDIDPSDEVAPANHAQVDLNAESLPDQPWRAAVRCCLLRGGSRAPVRPRRSPCGAARALRSSGVSILFAPNLAYRLNGVLLLAGIAPFLLENSSEVKLASRMRLLGQGNQTQSRIHLLAHRTLIGLTERQGLELVKPRGAPVWHLAVDPVACRLSRRLGPDNVLVFRRSVRSAPTASEGRGRALGHITRRPAQGPRQR